ncbi:hypothetical protein K239x_58630 [Planctomycetes bacterium K23_9]|uniref:Uncharacterized protein n=2 Tax=Stieleria marina TaxID=1930275 RepID=A0A517P3A6_9BACT|nr:hypothetical protein K239x_58630 [Planctomycetes bacterium K23_9]
MLMSAFCIATTPAYSQATRTQRGGGELSIKPGSTLPTVKVFDEAGDAFSTASLRGSYSVVVFGCLT